jgi:CBS domain-containing protein
VEIAAQPVNNAGNGQLTEATMFRDFAPLKTIPLQKGVGFAQPAQDMSAHGSPDSPALEVMTDLSRVTAVIVTPSESVDEAQRRMRQRGVRLLLVIDESRRVVGIVTATDVLGEKPMQASQARGVPHKEVMVADIMTPQATLEVLRLDEVRHAKAGHVVATLQRLGRQHALVVDTGKDGQQSVRGLFSASQIARQLGMAIHTAEIANTFAEIEATLSR